MVERHPSQQRRPHRVRQVWALLLAAALALAAGSPAAAKEKDKKKNRAKHTVTQKVAKKLSPALEFIQNEQYQEAGELLLELEEKADRLKPYERALVYQMLGFLESGEDRFTRALVYFEKCLAEDALPPSAQTQTRFNVAQLYLATDQFGKAVEALERWFEEAENPTSSAYYMLAVAHYQNGELEKALVAAETAVREAETVREPWLQLLVGLYYETQQYEQAQEPLEALIMLSPKKVYWTQLSSLYAHLGKEPRSLAVMQLAYSQGFLDKDRELRQLSQLYLYREIPYRAALVLEKGLADEIVAEEVDVFAMLANSWLLAREYDRAMGPLRRAAEMSEGGNLFARLGQVLLDREEWRAASDALSAALARGDLADEGGAELMLGMAYFYQDRTALARRHFSAARGRDNTRESAAKWLDLLDRESEVESETAGEDEAARDSEAAAGSSTGPSPATRS
jgi:tetratricopeptide (TPR) repeat protein